MKRRYGFVSNSSSCSFTIYKKYINSNGDIEQEEIKNGFLVMDNPEDILEVEKEAIKLGGYIDWAY